MKSTKTFLFITIALSCFMISCREAEPIDNKVDEAVAAEAEREVVAELWMTDFEAAKVKAKAENKPMLLDFTSSDWCVWCIKLDKEVFGEAAFKDYAAAELVLVELDFPDPKGQLAKGQSAQLKAQNEALAKQYGVRGFPTILLLSPDGELIEKTTYQPGGPEAYVEHIKGILAK